MPRVLLNDIHLYYEVHGEGPPVLWIPGLGVDVKYFAGLIGELATTCQVIGFDPRGAGESDKPDVPYSIGGMADDAVALLDSLDIGSATVVGCSMGGRVALHLALHHPRLVERLVLAATSARATENRVFSTRWLMMDVLPRIPLPKSVDPQPRYAWKRQRQAMDGVDCTERLGEIRVPTLVIHGTGDHLVPFECGQEIASGIPDARLVALPDGHQALFKKHGQEMIEEIKRFISSP